MFSGISTVAAETNWIVRPVIAPETSQVSCLGIYQDYSHQLMADKLILFIPGEFDQVQIQLGTEPKSEFLTLELPEKPDFAVTIEGEIFQQVLISDQVIVKAMKGTEVVGEYVINLTGIKEATDFLRTETCTSGDIYQFLPTYFLMYEDPQAVPMIVPNWDEPKPSRPIGIPSNTNTNIKFPRPSRDGLPDSTGGGGTRLIEEPNSSDTAF